VPYFVEMNRVIHYLCENISNNEDISEKVGRYHHQRERNLVDILPHIIVCN